MVDAVFVLGIVLVVLQGAILVAVVTSYSRVKGWMVRTDAAHKEARLQSIRLRAAVEGAIRVPVDHGLDERTTEPH